MKHVTRNMEQGTKILAFIGLFAVIALIAIPVFAEDNISLGGLVPCGTTANPRMCTVCDFFVLIQNIINFFLYVSVPLTTLAAIYIGFLFMFSGGSPQKVTEAKGKLRMVIIGLFWILGSWLVLNTVLNIVADRSAVTEGASGAFPWPWNKVNCEVAYTPQGDQTTTLNMLPDTQASFGVGEQATRDRLSQAGIPVNKSACPTGVSYTSVSGGCTSVGGLRPATVDEVIQLKQSCNCNVTVTGGSELGHATGALSHGSGYKVDLRPETALDNYITRNFTYIGQRADTAGQYRAPDGTIYVREGDHWDVTIAQ